jgi:hypothetical protein
MLTTEDYELISEALAEYEESLKRENEYKEERRATFLAMTDMFISKLPEDIQQEAHESRVELNPDSSAVIEKPQKVLRLRVKILDLKEQSLLEQLKN